MLTTDATKRRSRRHPLCPSMRRHLGDQGWIRLIVEAPVTRVRLCNQVCESAHSVHKSAVKPVVASTTSIHQSIAQKDPRMWAIFLLCAAANNARHLVCIQTPCPSGHRKEMGEDERMNAPKILFPTDFSPSARLRLAEAVALAKAWRSTLLILHVQESKTAVDWARRHDRLEPSFELVERMLNELATNDPAVPVLYRFSIDDPATEIVRVADQERVELIVMGGKRRGRFLTLTTGSVSDTVVRRAKCPVIVYNAPKRTDRKEWIGAVGSNKNGGASCGDDLRSFPSVCA